jgi:hypothetical protein
MGNAARDILFIIIIIIIIIACYNRLYAGYLQLYVGRDSAVGTVRGSNPGGGGGIFRIRPDRPWGTPSLLYSGCQVFFGGKVGGAWR